MMNTILPYGQLLSTSAPRPGSQAAAAPGEISPEPVQVDVVSPQSLQAAAGTDEAKPKAPLAPKVLGSLTGAFVGMQVGSALLGPIGGFALAYMGSNYGNDLGSELGTKKMALVAGATVLGGLAGQLIMGPSGMSFGAPAAFCLAEMVARS